MDVREKLVELLAKYFDVGDSYAYNLTRAKSAFSCGTMGFDDFEEFDEETVSDIADYLIANGVTVQENVEISDELLKQLKNAPITICKEDPSIELVREWISVNDKLPPYNHDVLVYRPNMAMKFLVDNYEGYYGEDDDEWYEGWAKHGTDIHGKPVITHWQYLPQPPKGE